MLNTLLNRAFRNRIPSISGSRSLLWVSILTTALAGQAHSSTGACTFDIVQSEVTSASSTSGLSKYLIGTRNFGAVGDGLHDDGPAIQKALDCAQILGDTTVFLDSGIYLFNNTLKIGSWSGPPVKVKLVGNSATLQTGLQSTSALLIQGYAIEGLVQGITFKNTHPLTSNDTRAIEFSGGSLNVIKNWTIRECTFQNSSRGILVSGVSGLLIQDNSFILDKGRDSGSSNLSDPNVGVWLFNNYPNGTSVDIEVTGNTYDGCAAGNLSGSVSQRCGDGFIFGKGSHVLIHNNRVKHFSFEGIFLARNGNLGIASPIPSSIYANEVNAATVTGDISGGGQWGIRSDDDYASILNNNVLYAVNGIWVDGASQQTNIVGSVISGNQIFMSSDGKQPVGAAIFTAGVSSPSITSNVVVFPSSSSLGLESQGIYLTGANPGRQSTSATVTGNKLVCYAQSAVGQFAGIFLQWASNWNITSNSISGCTSGFHLMNFNGALPDITTLTGANLLTGNTSVLQVTN